MTDKQKTIVSLSFALESCTAALVSIDTTIDSVDVVLADLDTLLTLVYNLSTKLALALKPASPAYSASIPVLQDLAQHVSALAQCTRLFHDDTHGAALAKDIRDRVKNIIDALRALIQTFLNNAARVSHTAGVLPASQRTTRSPYIAHGNQTETLSRTGLQEVARMIKDAENQDDPHDDIDDGWDEIGLGHSTSMTNDELTRSKNVHQILRLTTLLHKRIYLDILSHPSSASPSAFDTLLAQSTLLLSVSDDLAAALYSPQDPQCVRTEISKLADIATSLQTQLAVFISPTDELTKQMHALSVHDPTASATKKRADRKWFDTCVHQIVRLCANASDPENPTGGTS
ncbi:hypothetical protein JVU11DRAFT_571 [Chiua virens]|nr:hypothetical protein JVU11DRAFT_571 [Chiua virens]